jgi:transposase-like protein
MGRIKRQFNLEFKRKVVEEVRSGMLTRVQAIRQYELSDNLIYRWMDEYDHGKFNNEPTSQGALENKIAELERKVGQQTMEIELLKKAREYYQRQIKDKSSAHIPPAASNGGARS